MNRKLIRVQVLREVLAEALRYGAAYFMNVPLERFVRWLQAQLLDAEQAVTAEEEAEDGQ